MRIRLLQALLSIRPAPIGVFLKRALRIKRIVVHTAQGKYWLDPATNLAASILTNGTYEPNMQRTLLALLRPGNVFVDLGANEGYFTIQGAKLTEPDGRVIAVEPQDRIIPVLQENIRLNSVKNVELFHAAISDKSGAGKLHLAPDLNSGSSSFYRTTKYSVPTQTTKTITLAELLNESDITQVDLMKVDIEGAEYEAILGSPEIFKDHRIKAIALELHPVVLERHGKSASRIESFLAEAGYRKDNQFCNNVWLAPDA
jgi:FkbM family methyltransferase